MHVTSARKIFRLKNKALLGVSGDIDVRDLIRLLDSSTPRTLPSRKALADTQTDFNGILVFPKGQVYAVDIGHDKNTGWWGCVLPITDDFVAVGHGHAYAYGVMEAGGSAIDAVHCACKRDTTCALPLQWESIDGRNKQAITEPSKPKKAAAKRKRVSRNR